MHDYIIKFHTLLDIVFPVTAAHMNWITKMPQSFPFPWVGISFLCTTLNELIFSPSSYANSKSVASKLESTPTCMKIFACVFKVVTLQRFYPTHQVAPMFSVISCVIYIGRNTLLIILPYICRIHETSIYVMFFFLPLHK